VPTPRRADATAGRHREREEVKPQRPNAKNQGPEKKVIIPTPEQWAEEQLKNVLPRSEEWANRVARIYCLSIGDRQRGRESGMSRT
jgi:hypothetical protein